MSATPPRHVSVMPAEVLQLLEPAPGQIIVDATTGVGGHSRLLAERLGSTGTLIGLDQDASMLAVAKARLKDLPVRLFQANFDQLPEVLAELKISAVDGILADLGICSDQLDQAARGFSFQQTGPLDMRMNPEIGEPASALLQRGAERELADLIWQFGEERHSRRIARKIVLTRKQTPLETTDQLADLVRSCVPRSKGNPIDPATRVFQALRIAVNDEMAALDGFLSILRRCLKPRGRVAIISFHSLEDRRVKRAFADREIWEVLTRKPMQASEEEMRMNPRSRSAKLRAARRVEKAANS